MKLADRLCADRARVRRSPAAAQDTLKIAIGQINNWENQAPTLGEDAGIFKKHNLKIEAFGTQGAGETIQAVVSGSADLGAGVGVAGVMRAFSQGRAGARAAAGVHRHRRSLLVREGGFADQDPEGRDRAEHDRVFDQRLELEQHRGGVRPGTWRQGEADRDRRPARDVDAGDDRPDRHRLGGAAVRPKEIKEGKIRIIARGSDIPSLHGQTVRAIIVNANALKEKHDAIMRFAKGYREAVDWMYADPKALEMYSEKVKQPVDILRESLKEFHPKSAMQTDRWPISTAR